MKINDGRIQIYNKTPLMGRFDNMTIDNKIIVILGPTASGKTDLSIKLAKKYHGEVISADSRQVYKGLDIGSGKISKKEMRGVPHHLLDVTSLKKRFSVAQYQTLAVKAIKKVQKNHKIPFLVGGTGFYIQSIIDGIIFPKVGPNHSLRTRLAKKSTAQLFLMLKKLDPVRAATIDTKNPHRLRRAIEIVTATKKPVPTLASNSQFNVLQIGVKRSPETLKKLIQKRLQKRIKEIISEVKKLRRSGVSFRRLEELGLEYRFVARLLRIAEHSGQAQYRILHQEMLEKLQKEIEHFAKRQMTWFKRDKRIYWIKNQKQAEKLIKGFL